MSYRRQKLIRFSHCDPAGIVFYPRYIELCNEVVEDWFSDGLGVDFRTLHEDLRLGIPTVHLEVDFFIPSRHGDELDFRLSVAEIGRSSMLLDIEVRCGDEIRFDMQLKVVLISLDTMRSVPIDDTWRARFAGFMVHV